MLLCAIVSFIDMQQNLDILGMQNDFWQMDTVMPPQ
jgi:hypothetical protein